LEKLIAISAEQADLPRPALLGRVIGLPPKK
jgi:acyl-CoA thioester hydrolase